MTINSKKTFTPFKAINIKDVKDSKNKELFKTYKDKENNIQYIVLSDDMLSGDFVNALQNFLLNSKESYSIDFESFERFNIAEKDLVNMVVNAIYYGENIPFECKTKKTELFQHDLVIDQKKYKQDLEEAKIIADTSIFVRRLQDMPINLMRSSNFVDEIKKAFKGIDSVEIIVHDKKWLEKKGMNLLLGVNAGSNDEPYLIEARYIAEGLDKPTTALVGKGVCFDSGGYDLKPAPHMRWMKFDMSGAATVMGTVLALAKNKVKTNVVALGAMVANEIGPNAQHPDDIWQSYSGKYVEIDNTDAEGRLIMADTIAYAVKDLKEELKVNRLIDISTLTGAMIYALGDTFTGVWCTRDNSWQKYELAAKEAGELVWRMPFHKDFLDMLKSDIADISNSVSKPQGGSSRAAEFLKFFTDGIDYIHLDVAGTTDRNNKGQASMLRSMYNFVK